MLVITFVGNERVIDAICVSRRLIFAPAEEETQIWSLRCAQGQAFGLTRTRDKAHYFVTHDNHARCTRTLGAPTLGLGRLSV